MDQVSGQNAGSPPAIVLKLQYAIGMVELDGSCSGQPSLMMVV